MAENLTIRRGIRGPLFLLKTCAYQRLTTVKFLLNQFYQYNGY